MRSLRRLCLTFGSAQDFEVVFLQTSKEFYKIESESFLQQNSCPDYLKKVEERLTEEQDRVHSCLSMDYNSGEAGGIKQVVEHELIGRHMQVRAPSRLSMPCDGRAPGGRWLMHVCVRRLWSTKRTLD